MTTITYTARNGLRFLETELGTWMDTTDAFTDLTVNNKDLTEVGTLTQSAVNTNAPTMQYTGFVVGTYLQRAYDVDFDLLDGVGHALMGWVNVGTVTTTETIIDRQDTGGTGARYNLQIQNSGEVRASVFDGTNLRNIDSATDLNNTGWNFIVATWDDAGTQKIYINGVLDTVDVLGTSVGSLVNGTAVFRIGLDAQNGDPCNQGLSLCKVLPYEVSPADVLNVYNSEKTLFVENATYAVYDAQQTFTFPASVINRSSTAIKKVSDAIGGGRQVLFNREDLMWDITSSEMFGSDVLSFQHLLSGVMQGESFGLDAYETGEVLNCVIESGNYTTRRIETSDYFTFSFQVKEI